MRLKYITLRRRLLETPEQFKQRVAQMVSTLPPGSVKHQHNAGNYASIGFIPRNEIK